MLPLQSSDTSAPLNSPSSDNLIMLIIITGGLLFICLILLIIVMLRSKARKRKALVTVQNIPVKEESKKQPEKQTEVKKQEPVKQPEPAKKVVEVTVKKQDPKPVVEPKKEIQTPVVETKKSEPVKEAPSVKINDTKKETPVTKPVEAKTDVKKPDEVIIKTEEKKPEQEVKKEEKPIITTSIEQKKKEFHKALEETHSKEDNLKILQERLAELGKEKKTTVTFEDSSNNTRDPLKDSSTKDPVTNSQDLPEKEEAKVEQKENEKLVDLTALINEKLKAPVKNEEPVTNDSSTNAQNEKVRERVVNITTESANTEEPAVNTKNTKAETEENMEPPPIKSVQESEKILTPFFEKIKENEEPEQVINTIEAELKAAIDEQKTEVKEEPPVIEQKDLTNNQNVKDPNPKTFTEWLNTLKKN